MEIYQHNNERFEAMRFTGSVRSAKQLCAWANYDIDKKVDEVAAYSAKSDVGDTDDVLIICDKRKVAMKNDDYLVKNSRGIFCIVSRKEFKEKYRRVTNGMKWSK